MKYTVGELVDKLSIENVRLWMLQEGIDQCNDKEKAKRLEGIMRSNKMRNKWMAEIDKELNQDGFIKEKTY